MLTHYCLIYKRIDSTQKARALSCCCEEHALRRPCEIISTVSEQAMASNVLPLLWCSSSGL